VHFHEEQGNLMPPPAQREVPLFFVEVDPSQATPSPPKDAKYYSARNSQAANPDAEIETGAPKIDGTQIHVAKTETTPLSKPMPLQPSLPPQPPETPKDPASEAQPKTGPKPGDLAMAKPADTAPKKPNPDETQITTPAPVRPRTLAQAYQQHPELAGQKMKQNGGMRHHLDPAALDAIATPFGAYDQAIIRAVQYHWDNLITEQNYMGERTGKVVVEFRLWYDGHIDQVKVAQENVGVVLATLCQRAIEDPAPYDAWPSDMRRLIGGNFREITFTFFYE
ncbi:MAG TPA: hypothetical protein VH598_15990, partial [Verrucomicrobiae bacterium]|nr:hypothetical protein [Verrucomicrobiae bacterium]